MSNDIRTFYNIIYMSSWKRGNMVLLIYLEKGVSKKLNLARHHMVYTAFLSACESHLLRKYNWLHVTNKQKNKIKMIK